MFVVLHHDKIVPADATERRNGSRLACFGRFHLGTEACPAMLAQHDEPLPKPEYRSAHKIMAVREGFPGPRRDSDSSEKFTGLPLDNEIVAYTIILGGMK